MRQELPREMRYRLLKLKNEISERFTESNWEELGVFVGCTEIINGEDRLYRSLRFQDPDYDGHILSVLEKIARQDARMIDDVEQYVLSKFSLEDLGDVSLNGMICRPKVFAIPDHVTDQTLVALMIPFAKEFENVTHAIKLAAEDVGLRCERANDIWEDATIIQDIFSLIYRARIVVCDFSSRNPNVFYEAGIAHTLGREVVPLVQNKGDIPFDLQHHRHLMYFPNEQGLAELKNSLRDRFDTIISKKK